MKKEDVKAVDVNHAVMLFPCLNKGTLANLRSQKKGPKYFKVGKRIVYRVADIERWLYQNPVLTIDSIERE
jgi:hypothetical protein